MDDDIDLLDAAQAGDAAALEQLLRNHAPAVDKVCRRICADPTDAEDASQEALIAIVRGLARFDRRSSLSTWIHRVAANACLDEVRRVRRRPLAAGEAVHGEVPSVEPGPEDEAMGAQTRGDLQLALASLPEDFRVAVVLRDVADLEYVEIADILGVPVGTVRSRIAPHDGNHPGASDVKGSVGADPLQGLGSPDSAGHTVGRTDCDSETVDGRSPVDSTTPQQHTARQHPTP